MLSTHSAGSITFRSSVTCGARPLPVVRSALLAPVFHCRAVDTSALPDCSIWRSSTIITPGSTRRRGGPPGSITGRSWRRSLITPSCSRVDGRVGHGSQWSGNPVAVDDDRDRDRTGGRDVDAVALDLVARAISHRSDASSFAAARADRLGMDVALGRPSRRAYNPWPFWSPLPEWFAPGGNWQTGLATRRGRPRSSARCRRGRDFCLCAGLGKEALGLGDAGIHDDDRQLSRLADRGRFGLRQRDPGGRFRCHPVDHLPG